MYRADTIDITPTRPEHVLLVVEVVSPGSETTDRIVKTDQYAKSGTAFYWRVEQAATGVPVVYTYVLDPATRAYRDGDVFTAGGAQPPLIPSLVRVFVRWDWRAQRARAPTAREVGEAGEEGEGGGGADEEGGDAGAAAIGFPGGVFGGGRGGHVRLTS